MSYSEETPRASSGWLDNPLYGLDDFCYISLAELWKSRYALPRFWYDWDPYSNWTLFNVVFSLSFFVSIALQCMLYSWIGRESYGDCEDHTWVWHYSIWGIFAPTIIGSIAFLLKFAYDRVLGEPGGPEVYSLLNLVHPIGRTVMFVLGCTLWLKMVPSCTAMYYSEIPEILALYWFLIAWYGFSALVGWFAFFLSVTQLDLNTPFVRRALATAVDCTPWNFIKSYSILQMNGEETGEQLACGFSERLQDLYSKLQVALLGVWVCFCAWGFLLLMHDDAASYGTCADLVGVWGYVSAVLMVYPIVGVLMWAVRHVRGEEGARGGGGMHPADKHRLELLLIFAHVFVTLVLTVWGWVLWGRLAHMLRADCQTFFFTTHVGLTMFWVSLIFFLFFASFVNFTLWFIAVLRACSAPRSASRNEEWAREEERQAESRMDSEWYQRERAVV